MDLVSLLVGALIGLIVGAVVVWLYLSNRQKALQAEFADSKAQCITLQAEKKQAGEKLSQLQAENTRMQGFEAQSTKLQKEKSDLEEQLNLVKESRVKISEETEKLRVENLTLKTKASIAEDKLKACEAEKNAEGVLTQVPGVDAGLANLLMKAGVRSWAELGALSPARLCEIAGPNPAQPFNQVEIIKEARLKAGTLKKVDNLEDIVGIGPVIAKLMYSAGIFSFADLGGMTAEQLRGMLGERINRLANEDDLIEQARKLAAG